ncbi:MAG: helix-turn-helix domain-containing protein, partial [Christensenellaceae bacterium]|nr:helix-turn-helix domain-containing protein [Christensenellaceae bacterium]
KSVDSDKKEAMKEIKVCVQNIKGLWIPGEVWANTGLSWVERVLFSEIVQLSKNTGECFATNKYLADILGVSEKTIERGLHKLKELQMLELARLDGRNRFFVPVEPQIDEDCLPQNDETSLPQNEELSSFNRKIKENNNIVSSGNASHSANTHGNKPTAFSSFSSFNSKGNKFKIPTEEEVKAYAEKSGLKDIDIGMFLDYYESKGWRVGSTPMYNWQAAVRNWHRNGNIHSSFNKNKPYSSKPKDEYMERTDNVYTFKDINSWDIKLKNENY